MRLSIHKAVFTRMKITLSLLFQKPHSYSSRYRRFNTQYIFSSKKFSFCSYEQKKKNQWTCRNKKITFVGPSITRYVYFTQNFFVSWGSFFKQTYFWASLGFFAIFFRILTCPINSSILKNEAWRSKSLERKKTFFYIYNV